MSTPLPSLDPRRHPLDWLCRCHEHRIHSLAVALLRSLLPRSKVDPDAAVLAHLVQLIEHGPDVEFADREREHNLHFQHREFLPDAIAGALFEWSKGV